MYNLAVFISSFPYLSIKVGAVATGIVVIDIACRGGDNKLSSKIS